MSQITRDLDVADQQLRLINWRNLKRIDWYLLALTLVLAVIGIVVLSSANVYGPRQDPSSPYSGVISIFANRAFAGAPVTIFGDGEQTRDFVYVGDVARTVVRAFEEAVAAYQPQSGAQGWPKLEVDVKHDFPLTNIPEDHPVIATARQAAVNLGRKLDLKTTGGGADANVFFQHGIMTGVLGTGMTDVHTVRESIALADMVKTTALLLEIIRLHAL